MGISKVRIKKFTLGVILGAATTGLVIALVSLL